MQEIAKKTLCFSWFSGGFSMNSALCDYTSIRTVYVCVVWALFPKYPSGNHSVFWEDGKCVVLENVC